MLCSFGDLVLFSTDQAKGTPKAMSIFPDPQGLAFALLSFCYMLLLSNHIAKGVPEAMPFFRPLRVSSLHWSVICYLQG